MYLFMFFCVLSCVSFSKLLGTLVIVRYSFFSVYAVFLSLIKYIIVKPRMQNESLILFNCILIIFLHNLQVLFC